ncbi:MAG: hypothetical protein GXY08_10130 [Ruminococcus sp.]|mgnify:FL=1|nr:hypothetical protein [Ruminococcus sp.]
MKKIISFLLSAVMGTAALTVPPAVAEEEAKNDGGIVIFGDSIAAGFGLDKDKEYNYGQIIGDYLDCDVQNYAHTGDTTEKLLAKIDSLDADQKKAVADSDYIIVSIGGNDLMGYATKKILEFSAERGLLNPGFTADNIPEKPGITDLLVMVNLKGDGGLMDYAQDSLLNAMELQNLLKKDITNALIGKTDQHNGYIQTDIMPNIETAVSELRAMNPDARIIVQTVYQPIQFDPEYVEATYSSSSNYNNVKTVLSMLRTNFKKVMDMFRDELNTMDDIEVADVYYQFTSVPDGVKQNEETPGYSYLLTSMQNDFANMDFHPNQKGHLVIATTILEKIGDLHADDGLLTKVFLNMEPYKYGVKYPLLATDTYKRVAGNILDGDIDFNGVVDGYDATLALREFGMIAGGFKTTLSGIQQECADTNKDGSVDGSDATNILRYYAMSSSGYEGSFEDFMNQVTSASHA